MDGKAVKIKKSDLPNIYRNQLLEADYRRKTAETAELTRIAEQERQQIRQEREVRVNQLDTLASALYQELVGDQSRLAELLDTDPVAYLRVKQDMERKAQLLQQAGQQRHVLSQQQAAESDREYDAYLKAEQQKLQDKLPEWRDTKVRAAETQAIAKTLIDAGYSQEELGTLADHRALLLARDAMRWRTQQAIKAKQAQPQPQKTVQPGARNQPTNANPRADELRRKAVRTHKTEDILAYMTSKEH